MAVRCGIVGLPNVGKSTLFNALTETAAAAAENFPFCTIEPNVGQVPVPDERLTKIAEVAQSARVIPTDLTFVDIAGLVSGAAQGEGLGNRFLAHIREVDAVIHLVRCFEEGDISHVSGQVDPISDIETIETELMLADLESLERRQDSLAKKAKSGDKEAKATLALVERAAEYLRDGKPARAVPREPDDESLFRQLQLLTAKPILYVSNVDENAAATGNALSEKVAAHAAKEGAGHVVISAAIEAEIAQLDTAERRDYLAELGLEEPGLARVIRAAYDLLNLITFFTAGPKEARAWTVARGTKAPQAAGTIHSDFERGFIRAETVFWEDFVALGGESACRDAGKIRMEGKDYTVQDGDVIHFRFNV